MAAPRPYWKGYLKLSLVSCPIAVYSAVSSGERIAFRQINKMTGNRLRQQLVDEVTREPVEAVDKGRGYEVSKNVFMPIDDEVLDEIAIESSHTIEIDSFVPRAQIDERYLESPYYLAPNDKVGVEAFAVIREAMRGKDMVALGRIVLAKRERVIMLQAWENGLVGTTLRYPYEVRDAKAYFDEIPDVQIPKEMLTLAEHILESKRGEFEPEKFVDRYEEALAAVIKTKQAGMPLPAAAEYHTPSNVVNLMDALRRSLQGQPDVEARTNKSTSKTKGSKKRAAGQGEMLLPIAGKKAGAAAEAKPADKPARRPSKAGGSRRKAG
jgi:DNA end-binding protein Ku